MLWVVAIVSVVLIFGGLIFSFYKLCYCLNELNLEIARFSFCNIYFDLIILFLSLLILLVLIFLIHKKIISEKIFIALSMIIIILLIGATMYIPRKGVIPIKALEFADCKIEFDANIANQFSNFPTERMSCQSEKWSELFPTDWKEGLCSIEQDKEFLMSLKLLICERNTKFFQELDKTRKSYLGQIKDLSEEDREFLIKAFILDLITIDSAKYTILNCSCKKCPSDK